MINYPLLETKLRRKILKEKNNHKKKMLEESLLYVLAEGAAEQAANLKQSDILIDGVLSDSDRNDLIDQLFNMKVSDFQSLIRLPPIAPIVTPISSPPALPAPPGTSSDPEGGGGGGGRGAGKLASLYVKILKDNLKVGRRTVNYYMETIFSQ